MFVTLMNSVLYLHYIADYILWDFPKHPLLRYHHRVTTGAITNAFPPVSLYDMSEHSVEH